MVLIWPAALLGLILVGAVAAWALLRPGRQLAVVGSLALWQKALDAIDRSARRSSRRVTASWVLLLAGAAGAVLALSRPVLQLHGRGRLVSVALYPSAELGSGPDAARRAREPVASLLARLDGADRVELLRPMILGGSSGFLSPAEALSQVAAMPLLPVAARDLVLPRPDPQSQLTVRFVPAGLDVPAGPASRVVELPAPAGMLTIDALGAVELADGRAQLFVALRNRSARPWAGGVRIRFVPVSAPAGPWRLLDAPAVRVAPGARREIVRDFPAIRAASVTAERDARTGAPDAEAFIARVAARKRTVALIGPDEPLLRQFVQADQTLEQVADPRAADVVIANRAQVPAGRPAVLIDPDTSPAGWRRGPEVRAAVLDTADVAAADPVMRDVNLESVAVRRMRPWLRTDVPGAKVLAGLKGNAIILRSGSPAGGAAGAPRIHVAFELSWDNTNMAKSDAFVIFLANAVRWLAPVGRSAPTYEYVSPLGAGKGPVWTAALGGPRPPRDELPLPGVYRDELGELRAVSLVGLAGGAANRSPADAVAAVGLPQPQPIGRTVALWTFLAAAAAALWLAGWLARVK